MAVAAVVALALLCSKHVKAVAVPVTNPRCIDLTLPVSATSQNAIYDIPRVGSTIDAVSYELDLDTRTSPKDRLLRNITVSGTYDIAAKLCVPKDGKKKDLLHIATHGGVFDGRYWDAEIDPKQYSYVENVLDAGYSILTYDRLGNGGSDKPDPYKVNQLPMAVQILRGITKMARDGELMQYASSGSKAPSAPKFNKIIHVGHSLGSITTTGLITTYGNESDGAIITGFIPTFSFPAPTIGFDLHLASEYNPELFGDYPNGYFISSTQSAIQANFFSSRRNHTAGIGGFTPELLQYGDSIKSPFGVAELISAGQLNLGLAPDFKGPIQWMLAEYDWLVCGGDCRGTADMDVLDTLYPAVAGKEVYIQTGTGHGLPLHRNANTGFKVSLDFLDRNGL